MKSRRLSVLLTAWTRHPSSPLPSGPRLGLARVGLEGQAFQWGFLQTVGGELRTARPAHFPSSSLENLTLVLTPASPVAQW